MPYFGTDAFAAPILGIIGGLVMGGLGLWWLKRRTVKGQSKGLVFEQSSESQNKNNKTLPGFLLSITPLLVVFVLNFIFSRYLFPALDASYLSTSLYGNTSLDKVIGTWALVAALAIGVVALLALHFKHLENPMEKINQGTLDCMLPLFNTASEVGYGQVIATLSSFVVIKGLILGLFPSNPLISEAVAVNVLAGITGSASGGLSIALEALGASYLEMANSMGISPELLHRVASMSCGGFDTLPHNGAVITLLAICKSDHKRSYFDIFMVAVTFPVVATAVVITLGSLFGSF
jgi:H+/gluconate symporter-like permease